MITRRHPKTGRLMTVIHPGEYFACRDDRIIATLLGSCVAVCLRDPATGVCGMNHIMLPGDFRSMEIYSDPTGRYGMFAMELLLGEILKLGGNRAGLTAKIFGGGHILDSVARGNSIPETNVKFVKAFLGMEGVQILNQDVGGDRGRKIMFLTKSGDVMVKRLTGTVVDKVARQDAAYRRKLAAEQPKEGEVTLFE